MATEAAGPGKTHPIIDMIEGHGSRGREQVLGISKALISEDLSRGREVVQPGISQDRGRKQVARD